MKKFLIGTLIICLLIGIPFIVLEFLAANQGVFNISSDYETIEVPLDKVTRDNEIVYSKVLLKASILALKLQSDAQITSYVTLTSDKKILGTDTNEKKYEIKDLTGNQYASASLLLQPGKYEIKVTNDMTHGELLIGYEEIEVKDNEFERLLKIDQGDLNNPPEGYELLYKADLSELNYKNETIDTLELDYPQLVGLSVYTSATKGNVSVDLVNERSSFYGLVYPTNNNICDKLENKFSSGNYEIQLTSENADGEIYLFIKK